MIFLAFSAGALCGLVVGVPLGFMLRYALDLYELPRAADDPLDAVDADYGAVLVVRRDGGATVGTGNNGHA